jgi:cytoskeletal protein CcmA (bactofilin family)
MVEVIANVISEGKFRSGMQIFIQRRRFTMSKKNSEVKITTLLGADSEISGDFNSEGSVRIDGKVKGSVTVKDTLIIGASASISGNITAASIIIGGEILGDVKAGEKVELTASARVLGDISTNVIVIDEKAIFQGKCDMKQENAENTSKVAQTKALMEGKRSAKAAIAEALKEVQEEEQKEAEEAGAKKIADWISD